MTTGQPPGGMTVRSPQRRGRFGTVTSSGIFTSATFAAGTGLNSRQIAAGRWFEAGAGGGPAAVQNYVLMTRVAS